MNKILLNLSIFFLLNGSLVTELKSKIDNKIIVKVGHTLITSVDIQNEIVVNLILNKQEITQENINNSKNFAIRNLINKKIKRIEINKYEITDYNKKDLNNYIEKISKSLNTDKSGLKKIFIENNLDYNSLVEKYETELLWNTLIYFIYKNQINVNVIEVNNDLEKAIITQKVNNPEKIKEIKKMILLEKKNKKLNLFSRSHFSTLENTTNVDFR
tara:strand:+ start:4309 stop:4953 length:645 start_codon:yes stop_codon:yes gene_type:complete